MKFMWAVNSITMMFSGFQLLIFSAVDAAMINLKTTDIVNPLPLQGEVYLLNYD